MLWNIHKIVLAGTIVNLVMYCTVK